MNWLHTRRNKIELSQLELVARLEVAGYPVARTTISNWENDKTRIPLEDPKFARALANALKMSITDMLLMAGYPVASDTHTQEGRRAADIVDQLPDDKRELALGILEQILKGA